MRTQLVHTALLIGLLASSAVRADDPVTFDDLNASAVAAYEAEDYGKAIDEWERLRTLVGSRHLVDVSGVLYNLACSYALTGANDEALGLLAAVLPRGVVSHEHLITDTDLAGLRDDPRFIDIAESARLREEADRRIYDDLAYSTDLRPSLTTEEKIAGLSKLWAEAKFGFAFFDQVPDLDWDAVYISYIPRVIAAKSTKDYYRLLREMAVLLEDGHTNVAFPSGLRDDVGSRPGVRTSLVGEEVIITGIFAETIKEKGVEIGDELVAIDGLPTRDYAEGNVAPYVASSTPQYKQLRTYDDNLLIGDQAEPVELELRKADGERLTVELERGHGRPEAPPPLEWKILDGSIGYVEINTFNDQKVNEQFPEAMEAVRQTDGLIIDIRRNEGGSSGWWVMEYLSRDYRTTEWATREYRPVFRPWRRPQTWHRGGGGRVVSRRDWIYDRPVVLLVGPRTFSAAEDFAAVFQTENRGQLIGEATGGSTGQPLMFQLPGGGWVGICSKRDWMADGRQFVGVGIQPDLTVAPTAQDVREGRDPVMEVALSELGVPGGAPAR